MVTMGIESGESDSPKPPEPPPADQSGKGSDSGSDGVRGERQDGFLPSSLDKLLGDIVKGPGEAWAAGLPENDFDWYQQDTATGQDDAAAAVVTPDGGALTDALDPVAEPKADAEAVEFVDAEVEVFDPTDSASAETELAEAELAEADSFEAEMAEAELAEAELAEEKAAEEAAAKEKELQDMAAYLATDF